MLVYNTPKDGAVARSQSLRVHSSLSRCMRTPQCLPWHPKAGPSTPGKGNWRRGKGRFNFVFPHGVTFSRADQNTEGSVAVCRAGTVPQEGCAGQQWDWMERAVPSLVKAVGFSKASRIRSWAGSVTDAHVMVQSRDQTSCWFITFI